VNWSRGPNAGATLPEAEAHCAKHGRRAVMHARLTTFDVAYNCVE
jgi:hypothetical protein